MTTQETQPAQAMVQRCASKPVAWRFAYCGCDQMVWLHEPPNDPVFRDVTPLYERPPTKTDGAAFETIGQIVEAYYTLNDEALPADVRMALANIALNRVANAAFAAGRRFESATEGLSDETFEVTK